MLDNAVNLAVFISGSGSNLQSIIDHIEQGKLNAKIQCVISNIEGAYGLERAARHEIPFFTLPHSNFIDRSAFENAIIEILADKSVDLIVLAGFMRILSHTFIDHYPQRILNIHPSLLPKYKGLNTHARVLAAGDKHHGASVHVVTSELDSGEIIIQDRIVVEPEDNEDTLQQKIHRIEHIIYPQAISQYSTRIKTSD